MRTIGTHIYINDDSELMAFPKIPLLASSFVQGSLSLGPQKTDATEMRMASQSSSSAKGGAVAGQATILTQFF